MKDWREICDKLKQWRPKQKEGKEGKKTYICEENLSLNQNYIKLHKELTTKKFITG